MGKSNTTVIVIDNDIKFEKDPFIIEARRKFKEVNFFYIPRKAIK